MLTQIEICNFALDHLGKARIVSLGEATAQGELCDAHYDPARRVLLGASDWTFARRRQALAALAPDYEARWAFTYAVPGGALRVLRVLSAPFDPRNNPIPEPFEVREGKVYTNAQDAVVEYQTDLTDASQFSAPFDDALAFALAERIAWPLTKSTSVLQRVAEAAKRALSHAVTQDAGQDVQRYGYDGSGVVAREIGSHPFWGR